MCFRQWFERSLEIKSLSTVKVLNLRRLEHEFSYSMWFDFIAMQFVADTADFPAIYHVSDAKDITWNWRETSLHHKQFGKGIVKHNAFKLCFVQPLNLKVYCSHYWFFAGKFLTGTMYCMLQKMTKLRMINHLKLQMCFTGLKRSLTCCAGN